MTALGDLLRWLILPPKPRTAVLGVCQPVVCQYCDTELEDECITHDPNGVVVALLAHQMRDHWDELEMARNAMMRAIERGKALKFEPHPDFCYDSACDYAESFGVPHAIAVHQHEKTPVSDALPPDA